MPDTFNEEERTVEVVFATESPVRRMTWDGPVDEILVVDPQSCDLSRFNNGANILDNHDRWGSVIETVLGVVVRGSARIENRQGICKVRFANTDEGKKALEMVKDGILINTSIGYKVFEYQVTKRDSVDEYRAVSWEPNELSFVPVPADAKAQVRGEGGQQPIFEQKRNSEMDEDVKTTPNPESVAPPVVAAPVNPEPAPAPVDAIAAERSRASAIADQVRVAGLDTSVASDLISRGISVGDAATQILALLGKTTEGQRSTNAGVTASTNAVSDEHRRSEDMAYGLMIRSGNGQSLTDEQKQRGHNYRSMRLLDMASNVIGDTRGLSVSEIATRAFAPTSQFPVILEGVLNQTLLAAYQTSTDTWREFCSTGSLSDFRVSKRKQTGSLASLEVINENGEIKRGSVDDGESESLYLESFGKIIGLTRKALINDDLGAFSRLAGELGRAAARTIEEKVYAVLLANPTMGDGVALFHATHANYVGSGSGAVVSVATLDAARVAMSLQKDVNDRDYLDIRPYVLLCSTSQGGQARVVNDSAYDVDVSNKSSFYPNKVRGLFSKIVDTPRISGNGWYAFADPMLFPTLEVAFLDGVQTPFLEMQDGFEIDGKQWKVRLDFGVGAIGWRGAYRNYGS